MTLEQVAQDLGLIAAIAVAVGIILKAILAMLKFIRKANQVVDWIEEIYHEFKPNDGHSLSDHMNRIDNNTQVNARNIATVYGVILKGHEFDPGDAPLLEPLEIEPEKK